MAPHFIPTMSVSVGLRVISNGFSQSICVTRQIPPGGSFGCRPAALTSTSGLYITKSPGWYIGQSLKFADARTRYTYKSARFARALNETAAHFLGRAQGYRRNNTWPYAALTDQKHTPCLIHAVHRSYIGQIDT